MPTTKVFELPDSIMPPDAGRLIKPVQTKTIYDGADGLAVWRDFDSAIITTAREIRENADLKSYFGRQALHPDDPDEPFWNSNDVQIGSIRFRVDSKGNTDRDGDGKDMDTFIFRFSDLADQDDTGVHLWFNDQRVFIPKQGNGAVDVFAIRTDANFIDFKWDSGEDVGANGKPDPDGFNLLQPCTAIPQMVDDFMF